MSIDDKSINDAIEHFCHKVISAHNAHYLNCPSGLIDMRKTANPNDNQIYHLYSSGEITYQKGSWAYKNRAEFTLRTKIARATEFPFKFVYNSINDDATYVILTKDECEQFRDEMKQIYVDFYNYKKNNI